MVRAQDRARCHPRGVYRRRRFAVAFMLAALVAGLEAAAAHAGAPSRPGREVVVHSGDTLWALGERYAPAGTDVRQWIFQVEALNGLRDGALQAGSVLRLPR